MYTLIAELIEPAVLALSRSQNVYSVDTDARDERILCALPQKQLERTERRNEYYFRYLKLSEIA